MNIDCPGNEATKEIEVHPANAIFPMMSEEELDDLALSIKANGLIDPIVLDPQGKIVDGKCRYEACKRAGIEPRFKPLPEGADPMAFNIGANVRRTSCTPSQRALVAAASRTFRRNGYCRRPAGLRATPISCARSCRAG